MRLDDKYTDGVWYDLQSGDYCQFVETDEGVGLVKPGQQESEEPYYLFREEYDNDVEVATAIKRDFRPVPEEAVENPVDFVRKILDNVQSGHYGMDGLSADELTGLRYARRYGVEIIEA